MAQIDKDPQIANYEADVVIVGAGPVGLVIANYLGSKDINVVVLEQLDSLIDYPRAIGIDDEALRVMQSLGLIDKVLPHTTPHHWMRFLTPSGRCFASIEPRTDEFGWSRRNAFIQPMVDRVLYEGLARYDNVKVLFSRQMTGFTQSDTSVSVNVTGPDGVEEVVNAKYMVACDGGNSLVRRTLEVPFEGKTAPNKWIVIDVANDPDGTPNVYLCCDPVRPYVSAALPHSIRRYEFMVMPNETEEELSKPYNMKQLLKKVLPHSENIEIIRQRVYTHNARIADRFKIGNIILAGDAAHIMPVWQGQGYNSGIRDANNLAWKLAMVVKNNAGDSLLDSYQTERKKHAKAMIDLSVMAGNVLAPPKRWHGTLRDSISWLMNFVPPVKRYFLEMRFKPMPKYESGIVVQDPQGIKNSPVGKLFIQPTVLKTDGDKCLLDDVIGNRFALIAWGTNPQWGLNDKQIAILKQLDFAFVNVVPDVQLANPNTLPEGVIRIGDTQGRIKEWFGNIPYSMAVVRPDRFVAGLATPQTINDVAQQVIDLMDVVAEK